eukprot:GEZU01009347.1.p2 GENE.GEZU01009347.1~~GEZU01009347.1.p2  ORF type:complete len:126 (-),score=40.46 GEZU01009347.1:117-494(-)
MAAASNPLNVVYHLSDLEKVEFVLGNVTNHIKGVGGPQNVKIAVVVHGPALKAFHQSGVSENVRTKIAALSNPDTNNVKFLACSNTMETQKVTLQDLVPGFEEVKEGAVVRIAMLQSQGWIYLRP